MKFFSYKKTNTKRLAIIAMQAVFLLTLAYQVFYLFNLYQSLKIPPAAPDRSKVTRSNLSAYQEAVRRFQETFDYSSSIGSIPTPFKTAPRDVGP